LLIHLSNILSLYRITYCILFVVFPYFSLDSIPQEKKMQKNLNQNQLKAFFDAVKNGRVQDAPLSRLPVIENDSSSLENSLTC
jgi:hypothetical protein